MESSRGQFLIYETEDGKLKMDVRFENESVWLTQQLMAELFQTTRQNISLHIQNIYEERELVPESTVKKFLTVQIEGKRQVKRLLDYYNLDMIISVTGHTAAEIIHSRADAEKPNMGLTNYRGAKVRKQDVTIAKNYLTEEELAALNNLVEQYLIFAQGQAMRRIPMYMKDWVNKLNSFMALNDRDILTHAGEISHEMARELAEGEYKKFHSKRLHAFQQEVSDFDDALKKIESFPSKGQRKSSASVDKNS